MIIETLRMVVRSIRRHAMRSFLTVLGIIIGVAAIIALISMVEGVMGAINRKFYGLGAGKITIQAVGTPIKTGLEEEDLAALLAISGVTACSPSLSVTADAVAEGITIEDVTVLGRSSAYFTHEQPKLLSGRPLTAWDEGRHSRVCVISTALERDHFVGGSAINRTLWLYGQPFTVVGVAGPSRAVDGTIGEDTHAVILPYEVLLSLGGRRYIQSVDLYTQTGRTAAAEAEANRVLSALFNYRTDAFTLFNMDRLMAVMDELEQLMELLLIGIASMALLVGGIGIMNMMLVSVSERTGEIGLKKALGARAGHIQLQFLLEALILSLMGGGLGVLFGLFATWGASALLGIRCFVSSYGILLGVGFSAGVGILFGYAPARKASRLNPIDALRSH